MNTISTLSAAPISRPKPLVYALFLLVAGVTRADLNDLKVYTPDIEKGELGFEVLGNTSLDTADDRDGSQYHEFEFEYGVTDWWATSVTNSLVRMPDGRLQYNVLGWENTLRFSEPGRYWLDTGVHIELEFEDENEKADQVEVRLLFRRQTSKMEHVFNLNFEHQFGSHAEESLELEYIWRSKYALSEFTAVGFEAFGALGELGDPEPLREQEHIVGPGLYHEFAIAGIEIESHLAWLFGLTGESRANTFRWQLEFEF